MKEEFFITHRVGGGLGDTLFNLYATFFFAKKYNRSVIIDWRGISYNCHLKYRTNIYHSIFRVPDVIDGVKFYSCEEIGESDNYSFSHNFPLIKFTNSIEEINKYVETNKYINVGMRACEGSNNYKELTGNEGLDETFKFIKKLEVKQNVKDKIQFYKDKYNFPENIITIHVRHGNGEHRGGYDFPWYSHELTKEKIDKILEIEYPNGYQNKKFFICSDNKETTDKLSSIYCNSFSTEKSYIINDEAPMLYFCKNPITTIQEAFVDMNLLSQAELAIYTHHSVFNLLPSYEIKRGYYFDREKFHLFEYPNK